jgi:LCP family protein required for cell wall assembly
VSRTKKKKKKSFLKILIIVFIVVFALALTGFFLIREFAGIGKSPEVIMEKIKPIDGTAGQIADEFPNVNRVNFLVLGNKGVNSEMLTDTIIFASADLDNKFIDTISIPRDLYYERTDGKTHLAYQKINSQFATGGPTASALAVADVLQGTPIHFYAVVTDGGIKEIVDGMGGVEIDVPMDMHYEDKKQGLIINLKKGKQVLDGDQAVQYLRFRKGYAEGDTGRVKAQKEFVKEVFKQSKGVKFIPTMNTVLKNIERSIPNKVAAQIGVKIKGGKMKSYILPGESGMIRRPNGSSGSFFFEDKEKTLELMRKIYTKSEEKSAASEASKEEDPHESVLGLLGCK